MAHYDLAFFFARQGDTANAMAQWRAGHALLARPQPFSRPAYQEFIDASIEAFSAVRFSAGPRAWNDDPSPVFIVGMPRSGTTLCEQILTAHADAHGARPRLPRARRWAGHTHQTPPRSLNHRQRKVGTSLLSA